MNDLFDAVQNNTILLVLLLVLALMTAWYCVVLVIRMTTTLGDTISSMVVKTRLLFRRIFSFFV